jgi:hypothetical chaperone protein
LIIGMDFGTTNSGMATYDGKQVRLLPVDPASANPHVARTALYVTNDQSVTIGREAVNRYFDHNVGRPVKMKKVWVGEVEVYGADMFYIADVYTWVDVLSPGRLFLSVKSSLRDSEYYGTVVGGSYYSLENLIAVYLSLTRRRAEQLLGREIGEVVLGRPVRFSKDPDADSMAQRRLLEAAFRAGYEKVYLQQEPVAAAHHYAANTGRPQNILIFDFGGGTLDTTVMRLDSRRVREVLATGGIPVAGDVFDQRLVRATFPRHFGEGSHYGANHHRLPLPKWIYDIFSDWQKIIELQTPKTLKLLRDIAQSAEDRQGIEALISLVSNNYGLRMFDSAESAKRTLSSQESAQIQLHGPAFNVAENVTRAQFEQIIHAEIQAIDGHLDETVAASGLARQDIDAVIRTGGSSTIPAFQKMLIEKFGGDKLLAANTFSSVTSGLGIIAQAIEHGEMEAQPHLASEQQRVSNSAPGQKVPAVNLDLVLRRTAAREKESAATAPERQSGLILLVDENLLWTATLPAQMLENGEDSLALARAPISLPDNWLRDSGLRQAMVVGSLDEPLLLITSRYRFLLSTVRHLGELRELDLSLADYFRLRKDEQVCALGRWQEVKERSRMLLVTSRGYTRAYDVEKITEAIEGAVPFQFDRPLPGLAVAVLAVNDNDHVVICLDNGRAVRYCLGDIPLKGIQAIGWRVGERVIGARKIASGDHVVFLTENGYGKRMPAEWVPIPSKPNSRGRVMVARRPLYGLYSAEGGARLWAITPKRLLSLPADLLPLDAPGSTRSYRALKLAASETILAPLDS